VVRIVGGRARGRRLLGPPKGLGIRPTSDRVREAIFDVLTAAMPAGVRGRAIDLFAGTGALGIEALSRGAERVIFIEKNPAAGRLIEENLRRSGFSDRARVRIDHADRALAAMGRDGEAPFDLAFLDPPYGDGSGPPHAATLASLGLLAPEGIVILELGSDELRNDPPGLASFRLKRYGGTRVAFLRAAPSTAEPAPARTAVPPFEDVSEE
jgi:16S rRNA (guanine966-N2)-methyltransferase